MSCLDLLLQISINGGGKVVGWSGMRPRLKLLRSRALINGITINCNNRCCRACKFKSVAANLFAWENIRNGFAGGNYTPVLKKEQGDDFWIQARLKLQVGQPVFI